MDMERLRANEVASKGSVDPVEVEVGSGVDLGQASPASAAGFAHDDKPPVRVMVIPMFVMFQAYCCYISMQHDLQKKMNMDHTVFSAAASFMHWGKLVARVGHDIVFYCFSSYVRVYLAMGLALIGVLIPPIFVWILGMNDTWIPFAHFFLVGVGVGIFEVTYLSVIAELGQLTKFWAILGCPLGIAWVNIFGSLAKWLFAMPPYMVYWYVAATMPCGMFVYLAKAPKPSGSLAANRNFGQALAESGGWIGGMLPFFFAKVIGSFVMENSPGWFYVFDAPSVSVWGPTSEVLMNRNVYFAWVFLFVFLGDGISRRVPYWLDLDYSRFIMLLIMAILTSLAGLLLQKPVIAALTFFAAFVAFWGNGLGYALATKYIDRYVPKVHNRAVYGMWAMVGDVGGILGAVLTVPINNWECGPTLDAAVRWKYQCTRYAPPALNATLLEASSYFIPSSTL